MSSQTKIYTPQTKDRDFASFSSLRTAPGPYVQAGDFLTLSLTTSDSTGTVTIAGRLLTLEESIVPFTKTMTFSGTGSQTEIVCPLTDGWIIGFDVFRASGTITDGEVVAAVHVVQGSGTGANRVMCLASGEVTDIRSLGLGAFLIRGPEAAASAAPTVEIDTATPAAGAEISITVPAGEVWEPYALKWRLVTDATVASRAPAVIMDDGTNVFARWCAQVAQTASQTRDWQSGNVGALWTPITGTEFIIPFSPTLLAEGYRVRTNTVGIQAADQYSLVVLAHRTYTV